MKTRVISEHVFWYIVVNLSDTQEHLNIGPINGPQNGCGRVCITQVVEMYTVSP